MYIYCQKFLEALSEDALRELFIKAFPLPCDGTRCCLLVLDNIDILEAQEQEELRKSLAGAVRTVHTVGFQVCCDPFIHCACCSPAAALCKAPLKGLGCFQGLSVRGWACLDSWKVVEIEIMTLPPEATSRR